MWLTLTSVISALAGVAAILFGWTTFREKFHRRDDVFKWANEAIAEMQSLWLLCSIGDSIVSNSDLEKRLSEIAIKISILLEQGRLLFKNDNRRLHTGKPEAYRGYRPRILDSMVPAHQIACNWMRADEGTKLKMQIIAEDCVKNFLDLAQKEIGRKHAKSKSVVEGGKGLKLEILLDEVQNDRIEAANFNKISHKMIGLRSSFATIKVIL